MASQDCNSTPFPFSSQQDDPVAYFLSNKSVSENLDLSPFKWMEVETVQHLLSGTPSTPHLSSVRCPAMNIGNKKKQIIADSGMKVQNLFFCFKYLAAMYIIQIC